MKSIFKLFTTMVIMGTLAGCATLFGHNNHSVMVNSNPQGAKVYINNQYRGVTPTQVVLTSLWSPTPLQVSIEGAGTITKTVAPTFQPVGVLNIFFFPGFFIDAISGNMMRIPADQKDITANFPRG